MAAQNKLWVTTVTLELTIPEGYRCEEGEGEAFMYEPIVDMSDEHLRRLYADVLTFNANGQPKQQTGTAPTLARQPRRKTGNSRH